MTRNIKFSQNVNPTFLSITEIKCEKLDIYQKWMIKSELLASQSLWHQQLYRVRKGNKNRPTALDMMEPREGKIVYLQYANAAHSVIKSTTFSDSFNTSNLQNTVPQTRSCTSLRKSI